MKRIIWLLVVLALVFSARMVWAGGYVEYVGIYEAKKKAYLLIQDTDGIVYSAELNNYPKVKIKSKTKKIKRVLGPPDDIEKKGNKTYWNYDYSEGDEIYLTFDRKNRLSLKIYWAPSSNFEVVESEERNLGPTLLYFHD